MEIKKTKDYKSFRVLNGNRPVNTKHVSKLVQSMKKNLYDSPIQVNERMEVVDGQHRLAALQLLGLPVSYYISKGSNLNTVQVLNSHSMNWNPTDYLESYISKGKQEYIEYKNFIDKYNLTHSIALHLLTGISKNANAEFNSGNLKIKNLKWASSVAEKINIVSQVYPGAKRRTFCQALAKCLGNPSFSFDEFMRKLSYQRAKMYDCSKVEQYLELIEEIYNFKRITADKIVLRSL